MSVSGNEEAKVLAGKSSDISAGIPLKKRRFFFVPTSPPHNESPTALSEVVDVKRNEEYGPDLKVKEEEARSDCKEQEASSLEKNKEKIEEATGSNLQNNEKSPSDSKDKEKSTLDLKDKEKSTRDLKDKEESLSGQGTSSTVTGKSPDAGKISFLEVKKEIIVAPSVSLSSLDVAISGSNLPELRHVDASGSENRIHGRTEILFLTGKSAASEVSRITGPTFVNVKKEMESKQMEDCNLNLSSVSVSGKDQKNESKGFLMSEFGHHKPQSIKDILHPSVLSLSLNKEVPILGNKSADADRSNWDLNTTMDAWEGSVGNDAMQCQVDGLTKKTDLNNGRLSSGSSPVMSVLSEKGKQVVFTNDPKSSFPDSPLKLTQQAEDSLRLTLSPSFSAKDFGRVGGVLAGVSTNIAYRRDVMNMQSTLEESSVNKNTSGFRVIKSEPTEENSQPKPTAELLDVNSLKSEKQDAQALSFRDSSTRSLSEQMCIKSEPTVDVCARVCSTPDLTPQEAIGKFVPSQESGSSSSMLSMPVTPPNPSPSRIPASSELSISADISNQSEHSVHTKESYMGTDVLVQSAADMNPSPVYFGSRDETLAANEIENRATEATNVDDSTMDEVKEHLHDLCTIGEGSVSDEEKLNISAEIMEDDESFGSDCESDGNQALGSHLENKKRGGRDDEEYEDGEVRENNARANEIDAGNAKLISDRNDCPSGFHDDADKFQLDKDKESKIHDNLAAGDDNKDVGVISNENYDQLSDKDCPSQNLSSDCLAETVVHEQEPCISYRRKSVDNCGAKSSVECTDNDKSCDGISSGSRILATTDEPKIELVKAVDTAEKPNSSASIVDTSCNDNCAPKESNHGVNRSRIINLPRASATSPCRTKSVSDKLFPSRNGRERYPEFEAEKFFLLGNRDEMDTDGSHRFIRGRIQDQSFRNSRGYYSRGRGRFSGRLDASRSEWGSDRDFTFGSYRDDYRFPRNKRVAPISDNEHECDDFVVAPDGVASSSGRGRKSLNDDLPSFRHSSSRRFSPGGGRDDPSARGIEMLRRIPRNISPGRRNEENGIDLVGIRHDEKFVRVLADDIIDHAYTRPHSMYEGGDGQFIRGNRNFPAFQRRGFPRVRSKSPVGARARPPGPWSSPRRRSPDGFNGLPHLPQHRSPNMYGVERMRSPDHSCFPEQMVARRRSSPSYMARPFNDSRDLNSRREHGHPRPINAGRSPPERGAFSRSNKRLDDIDPRIRKNDDEYFGRPVHSSRFQEFQADASSDERRKIGERRGLTRPFRPAYIGDSDNAHTRFHSEDDPRPLRFCSDADAEFAGRVGGMREREAFEGRMKNRELVPPPRRIRSIDDQEGSYRHSGQVWHDDAAAAFNEGSGFKRRRF